MTAFRRVLAPLLLSMLSLAAFVPTASASLPASTICAPSVYGNCALVHVYDAPIHAYDGATHSVPAHVESTSPVAPEVASPGIKETVTRATAALSVLSRISVAANSEAEARALLASIGEDGRTAGVLNIDGELTPLVSGADSLPNYAASGHVEGQAALIMREQGVSYAELLIDNPNGICSRCVSQVPTLLPGGAELTATSPFGPVPKPYWFNSRTIVGNASDPKSWPR